jgi:hypothetical protein
MAKSIPKMIRVFLVAGVFVPCLLQTVFYLKILPIERMPEWLFVALWPAFGFYMASDTAILGFTLSVLANALVYGLVGTVVLFLYRRFFRRAAHELSQ